MNSFRSKIFFPTDLPLNAFSVLLDCMLILYRKSISINEKTYRNVNKIQASLVSNNMVSVYLYSILYILYIVLVSL